MVEMSYQTPLIDVSSSRPLLSDQGLVLQLFELGKLFVDKKIVTFRAQGICMYPCIQPSDILHLESRSLAEIWIGDIAVYRRHNRLFAHRAVGKVKDNNTEYLLTRADTARSGNDGPIADKDILGIVSKIERKGNFFSPAKKDHAVLQNYFFTICYCWYRFKQRVFNKAVDFVYFLQRFKAYHKIAKILFSPLTKRIHFTVQAPLDNTIDCRFHRVIIPQELPTFKHEIKNGCITKFTIVATINKKAVACIELISRSHNSFPFGQWTPSLYTKIRYRCTGIEEKLYTYADELFKEICEIS